MRLRRRRTTACVRSGLNKTSSTAGIAPHLLHSAMSDCGSSRAPALPATVFQQAAGGCHDTTRPPQAHGQALARTPLASRLLRTTWLRAEVLKDRRSTSRSGAHAHRRIIFLTQRFLHRALFFCRVWSGVRHPAHQALSWHRCCCRRIFWRDVSSEPQDDGLPPAAEPRATGPGMASATHVAHASTASCQAMAPGISKDPPQASQTTEICGGWIGEIHPGASRAPTPPGSKPSNGVAAVCGHSGKGGTGCPPPSITVAASIRFPKLQ